MKVLAPVNDPREVAPLIEAGADELYCGFLPPAWSGSYSVAASPNRREWRSANISSHEGFARIVAEAHGRNVPVHVAVNALYTKGQYPAVFRQIAFFRECKVDALIVADLGLLACLKKERHDVAVHVSTGGTTFNASTARFYRSLGAKRIVLPRHVRIEEARALIKECPGMEFEMFIMNSGCKNIDGLCTFQHGMQEMRRTPLWDVPKKLNLDILLLDSLRRLPEGVLRRVRSNVFGIDSACLIDYAVALRASPEALPPGVKAVILKNIASAFRLYCGIDPCGACRLAELWEMGLTGVKIVGRNYALSKKLRDVRFIKEVLRAVKEAPDKNSRSGKARASFRKVYKTECRDICYYPYENTPRQSSHTH